MNLHNKCKLQIIEKLRVIGKELGRTPTIPELQARGIWRTSLETWFGSYSAAIEGAGLTPRKPAQGAWINRHLPVEKIMVSGTVPMQY